MCAGSLVSQRLASAGLTLPSPPDAFGDYTAAVRTGTLVFTAGQLPVRDGELTCAGRVGSDVLVERARECAGTAALNALAAASAVCDLDDVVRVVKLVGYVSSADGFVEQPQVIDGASAVMTVAFGEAGLHAREAVGVAALPLGASVEVSVVLEVRSDL